MNLRSCLLRTRNQLTTTSNLNLAKPIENFLSIPTKGSKRFRKFFERDYSENLRASRSVTTFYSLIDLPVPVLKTLKTCVTLWSHNFIGNDLRDFFFKCRQNYLSLNNRRAAYDPDVNPLCTFCRIRDPVTANRESFDHLFFSCHTTRAIIDSIITNLFNVVLPNEFVLKQLIWNGEYENNDEINFPLVFFWESVRYIIYRYKIRKRVPNYLMVSNEALFIVKNTIYNKEHYKMIIDRNQVLARWLPALG
jgi:hypothetical protein